MKKYIAAKKYITAITEKYITAKKYITAITEKYITATTQIRTLPQPQKIHYRNFRKYITTRNKHPQLEIRYRRPQLHKYITATTENTLPQLQKIHYRKK